MCSAMVTVVENGHGDSSSNPTRSSISRTANTLGKDRNQIILPLVTGKQ